MRLDLKEGAAWRRTFLAELLRDIEAALKAQYCLLFHPQVGLVWEMPRI